MSHEDSKSLEEAQGLSKVVQINEEIIIPTSRTEVFEHSNDYDPMANTAKLDSGERFDWAEDVEDGVGSREETCSHFSDSSSDDGVAYNRQSGETVPLHGALQHIDGSTLAESTAIDNSRPAADIEDAEVQAQDDRDWLRGAFRDVAILPYGGFGEKDTSGVYRRDAQFFHNGSVGSIRRSRQNAKHERMPSLLNDSGAEQRYRIQRDQARKERDDWRQHAYDEYVEKTKFEEHAKTADEGLREAEEERGMLKHAIDTREQRLEDLKTAFGKQKAEAESWRKAFEKQRPLADAERERQMLREAGYEDMQSAETQTDAIDVQSRGTQSSPLQPPSPMIQMSNAETQTDTETADAATSSASIDKSHAKASLSLVLPPEVRSRVVSHAMEWAKAADRRNKEFGSDIVTAARVKKLLGDEQATFEELVSVLEQDRLRFQPRHLAQELERFVRPLATVPTAILYAARGINNTDDQHNTLLEEVSQLQQDSKQLQPTCTNTVTPESTRSNQELSQMLLVNRAATIMILSVTVMTFLFDAREALVFRQLGASGLAAHVASFFAVTIALWLLNEPAFRSVRSNGYTEHEAGDTAANQELEAENNDLPSHIAALRTGNNELRRGQDDLEQTVGALREQLDVADTVADQLQKGHTELETQLIESREYSRQLKKQGDELEHENRNLERKTFQLRERLSSALSTASGNTDRQPLSQLVHSTDVETQLGQFLEHSREIKKQQDLLRLENVALRRKIEELTGRLGEFDLHSIAAQLHQSLERSEKLQKQRDWLRSQNKQLERKNEELIEHLRLAESKSHPQIDLQSMTEQLEQVREHCTHLETHCEVLETERQRPHDNVTDLTQQLQESNDSSTDPPPQLERVERDNQDLQNTVDQLTNELIAIRSRASPNVSPIEPNEKLRRAIQLEAQNNSLITQTYELEEKLAAAKAAYEKLVQEKEDSNSENKRLDDECVRLVTLLQEVREWTEGRTWTEIRTNELDDNSAGSEITAVQVPVNDDCDAPRTPAPFPPIPHLN